ncbi:ATP-binding protein [Streptomyces sp. NPDC059744]|uniref:ATP-binding protein n=1 Tax=Streptomyces sp. NPDC059744 TaxID=3346929 RepID=UPI003650F268
MILLGPPGTGKPHLAVALAIRACLAGQRTLFATAVSSTTCSLDRYTPPVTPQMLATSSAALRPVRTRY